LSIVSVIFYTINEEQASHWKPYAD